MLIRKDICYDETVSTVLYTHRAFDQLRKGSELNLQYMMIWKSPWFIWRVIDRINALNERSMSNVLFDLISCYSLLRILLHLMIKIHNHD